MNDDMENKLIEGLAGVYKAYVLLLNNRPSVDDLDGIRETVGDAMNSIEMYIEKKEGHRDD